MKIKLYPCFKNWLNYGTIYIYSDPHFSDFESYAMRFPEKFNLVDQSLEEIRNHIITLADKKIIEELDDWQVNQINSKVGKKDVFICLGDVGNIEYVRRIRGYKVLIAGNHDLGSTNYQRAEEYFIDKSQIDEHGKYKVVYGDNHLFDEVYDGSLQINSKIILSHEPVYYPYCFNIHGHVHNLSSKDDKCHLNTCAEHINYTPINLNSLLKTGFAKYVKDIHRETIDNAVQKIKIIRKN